MSSRRYKLQFAVLKKQHELTETVLTDLIGKHAKTLATIEQWDRGDRWVVDITFEFPSEDPDLKVIRQVEEIIYHRFRQHCRHQKPDKRKPAP